MEKISKPLAAELSPLQGKDYLSCADFTFNQTISILELANQLKNGERRIDLGNRVLGLIFTKASTRTRVSFQVAMAKLGGQTIDLNPEVTQVGRGEPLKDTARVLSSYCDALAIRTFKQEELIGYADWASIPVINALTDLEHPCQALADFLTMQQFLGSLRGQTLTYIGDGNNVANSLLLCGAILGVNIRITTPKGFEPKSNVIERARSLSSLGSTIEISNDPSSSIKGANAVYTDVWASMGQESEKIKRKESFQGFCLNKKLLLEAEKEAIILHCLPAHRGEEITDDVIESENSRVFDQAENRLHVQHALLATLLGGL
tara:strand:- start:98 stop:1054 length:957 start_codon:yes stop_codon:yes gene_type:complete